jgi:hypothetical protein
MDDVREIIRALGPNSGELHWSITLYWMFLVNLVLLLISDSAMGTNIAIGVRLAVFIDKTFAFGYMFGSGSYTPQYCHAKIFIGTYLIRTLMFAGPLIVAGQTESGKVRAAGILAGLTGAIYMLARWYFDQRDVEAPNITCQNVQVMAQSAGIVLLLARLTLRHQLSLVSIHRHVPGAVTRDFAAHHIEV